MPLPYNDPYLLVWSFKITNNYIAQARARSGQAQANGFQARPGQQNTNSDLSLRLLDPLLQNIVSGFGGFGGVTHWEPGDKLGFHLGFSVGTLFRIKIFIEN